MASTYTTSLRLTKQATGDNFGTWGEVLDTGVIDLVDQAVAGRLAIAMTDADYTLSATNGATDESRYMVLRFTGVLTAGRNIIVPTVAKLYIIENATTGGFALTVKPVAGTGIAVVNGLVAPLRCDATNVVSMFNIEAFTAAVTLTGTQTLTNKTLTSPVVNGATLNGITEGSVVANSTTAYTIDNTSAQLFVITLTGNCTYTFPTAILGKNIVLIQKQDGTGSRTVIWPASVKWPSNVAPVLTATASKGDKFNFTADGTYWVGNVSGQNYY